MGCQQGFSGTCRVGIGSTHAQPMCQRPCDNKAVLQVHVGTLALQAMKMYYRKEYFWQYFIIAYRSTMYPWILVWTSSAIQSNQSNLIWFNDGTVLFYYFLNLPLIRGNGWEIWCHHPWLHGGNVQGGILGDFLAHRYSKIWGYNFDVHGPQFYYNEKLNYVSYIV